MAVMSETLAIVKEKAFATCQYYEVGQERTFEVHRGTLVEVKGTQGKQNSTVRIYDPHQKNLAFENNLYTIKCTSLLAIPRASWHFLAAIIDPHTRANIAADTELLDYIIRLKVKSFVTVNGFYFSLYQDHIFAEKEPMKGPLYFECIIRYIGPVDEIGPGYFFGLELLVNTHTNTAPHKNIL